MKVIYQEKTYIVFPFLLSLFFYVSVLGGILLYTYKHQEMVKRYTSKKDDFLQIALVERKKEAKPLPPKEEPKPKEIEKKPQKQVVQKSEPIVEKQDEVLARNKHESVALKELFGKIKTKEAKPKPIPTTSKSPSQASRLKPKKAKKAPQKKAASIAKSLSFKTTSLASNSSVGEYDEFLGEVQEILDGYWNQTIDTISGASAKVKIDIDSMGNFSYTIVSLSYNDTFNIKLKQFLELMKDVMFPKNMENKTLGTIVFKDLQEER